MAAQHNFTVFDRRAAPRSSRPMAILQRRALLSLNRAAMQAIGDPEAVRLLYDEQARVIGLQPADIRDPMAYSVRRPTSSARLVSLARLCAHYGISTDTAMRYAADVDDGVLIIDLKKPVGEATRPRAKETSI